MTEKSAEVTQKVVFPVTWKNDKKPPYVILPRGRRVMVDFMAHIVTTGRNVILFDSGDVGEFFWELDDKKTGEKRIRVEMEK